MNLKYEPASVTTTHRGSNLGGESVVASDKCTMAFVSHRCVPLDDDGATYHKVRPAT